MKTRNEWGAVSFHSALSVSIFILYLEMAGRKKIGVAATTTHHAGVPVVDAGCAGAAPANGGGIHVHVALPASCRYGKVWVSTPDSISLENV